METPETIISDIRRWVENRESISPHQWLDASARLNVLRSIWDDEYFTLEHNLSVDRANLMSSTEMTSAKAEIFMKSRPEYLLMRKMGAKIKQLEEFVRIAKKMASLKEEEFIQQQ